MRLCRSSQLAVIGLGVAVAVAQDGAPDTGLSGVLGDQFRGFERSLHDFDWESEAQFFNHAIERVFENNGWKSESHLFARDLAMRVAAVPPWDLARRLQTITDAVQERYGISSDSAARLQGSMMREATGLFLRHAKTVVTHGNEMLATRKMNQPITAEQVTRWSRDSRGFMFDAFAVAKQLHTEIEPMVPAHQKHRLQTDWESYTARQKLVEEMIDEWAQGRWQPSHWGLDADSIQAAPTAMQKQPDTPAEPRPDRTPLPTAIVTVRERPDLTPCTEDDPATWYVCVREFSQKYRLNAAQVESARSIHDEIVGRAQDLISTHSDHSEPYAASPAPGKHRPSIPAIRDLFRQLNDRLEALSTTSQRQNAGK